MRAIVWEAPGELRLADVPRPLIRADSDAIVHVQHASTCGTDLHAYRGAVARFESGTILGHEFVGIVEEVGPAVSTIAVGQRVRASDFAACGVCRSCASGRFASCANWMLFGFSGTQTRLDGALAQYVRVPWADVVLSPFAPHADPRLGLLAADVLPTALDAVSRFGDRHGAPVAVVGAGPIGMAVAYLARDRGHPVLMIERRHRRAEWARAAAFDVVADGNACAASADICVDAAGGESGLRTALRIVRAGGAVVAAGAQGGAFAIDWHDMCKRNLTLSGVIGDSIALRAHVDSTIASRAINVGELFSDRVTLESLPAYYERLVRGDAFKAVVDIG